HSVILSTHILPEVQAVCSHVQIINHGQLIMNNTIGGLFNQMQSTHIQIGFHNPPSMEQLKQIQYVEDIEILENNKFRIQHSIENSPVEILVEQSVNSNWKLYELIPEQRTLEQIFVDLTNEDNSMEVI
ncbi:ABC transporter ATP-binding protein, partial [Thiotrichales bacterium HSG1]|nr:ABC transporter ATP-binding protein [Thiotrichales bacterium HSG1]